MTDKKLTDNEIKDLLEYKAKAHCEMCDLKNSGCCDSCIYTVIKQGVDLINRLQERVEKCEKVEHYADKTIATLQAENERLETVVEYKQGIIDVLFTDNSKLLAKQSEIQATATTNMLRNMEAAIETAKAEAYKEFAERLTDKFGFNSSIVDVYEEIDNLLKELVGEDK